MHIINANKRVLGLVSGALFVTLFLGLYKTMTPSHTKPQIADKLGLNPAGQASSARPGVPAGSQDLPVPVVAPTSGRVLAEDLVLHDSPATYPRLTRLSDDSILLAFMRPDPSSPARRVLVVKRSVDNGRTFAPWGEVARCDGDCGNLFLLEVPASAPSSSSSEEEGQQQQQQQQQQPKVLAAFRNHDVVDPKANRRPTYFRITVCESLDGGRTWTYLSQAAEKPAPMGLWEPFMRIGAGGEVQLMYSQELEPRDQDTMMRVSYDRGKTWSAARTVSGAGEKLRDGMTGIAATTDRGKPALVMVFETTRHGRTFSVEAVVSYDDGENWGHRQVVFEPQKGANAGAPQIEAFANGGLATVFMSDAEVDARDWPRKAAVKTIFGGPLLDGKIQWLQPETACPAPSFWPGILRLSDIQLLVACDHAKGIHGRVLEWP